jgi:hypothetical protein
VNVSPVAALPALLGLSSAWQSSFSSCAASSVPDARSIYDFGHEDHVLWPMVRVANLDLPRVPYSPALADDIIERRLVVDPRTRSEVLAIERSGADVKVYDFQSCLATPRRHHPEAIHGAVARPSRYPPNFCAAGLRHHTGSALAARPLTLTLRGDT